MLSTLIKQQIFPKTMFPAGLPAPSQRTANTRSRKEWKPLWKVAALKKNDTSDCTRELLFTGRKCNGIMGVPITFLDKYNPEQFEIIGATESEGKGFSCGLWNESSGIAQPVIARERKYKRIFISSKMQRNYGSPYNISG